MPDNKKTSVKVQQPALTEVRSFFGGLYDKAATIFFAITVVILPLYMSREKYTAITAAKATFFSVLSMLTFIAFIILTAARFIYESDAPGERSRRRLTLREQLSNDPLLLADGAIILYWLLMLVSCFLSEDIRTSFYGIDPRDNGFMYQTLYVAAYFIISRAMKPTQGKALIFVWGGAILGVVTILHYFGVDIYDVIHYSSQNAQGAWVDKVLSESYSGPFWNSTSYKFLGPVGNVNLGSYILSVALVLAAGFYVTGVQPMFAGLKKIVPEKQKEARWSIVKSADKYGISLLICFVITLYAELNINTDAGLVAIAAAVVTIPVVLCGTLERLCRGLVVFALAFGTAALSYVVDSKLCGESIGSMGKVLLAATVLFAVIAAAAFALKNKEAIKKAATPKRMRMILAGLMALAIAAGIGLSLYITEPDDTAAGALSGATVVLQRVDLREKSDTIIHELGQILRGNLDDSFGHNRLFTWKRTVSLVKHNPIFGIGPDNFKTFFARYYRDEAVEMFPAANGNLDKAHNEFLDVLLSNGILGFTAYMLFFGALLWCCFRKPEKTCFAPVFGVAVVSYMAHAFFGYQLPIHSPVMWMLIGAAAAYARAAISRNVSAEQK